jgi:hypothetical protein
MANCSDEESPVSAALATHALPVSLTPVKASLTGVVDPASNFAGFLDTGNASFAGVNDTSNACIAGVVDTNDALSEILTVLRSL